jgi:hypothetical protein
LEKIQRQTDGTVKDVTEIHQEWSKLRKMQSSWKSRFELKSKLLIKLEKDSEKIYSLARELQDLPLPEVEIHLTRFQGMTQTQLGLLAKYCHKLKASIEGKRHYPSGKLKGSLPRLEPIVEQHAA